MFLINPIQHWSTILILIIIQLTIMLFYGWIVKSYIRIKYGFTSASCSLFRSEDYTPNSSYEIPKYPQYSLVLVRFNPDRTIQSEVFYTNLGNRVHFEYENGQRVQARCFLFSSLVLVTFAFLGLLPILAFSIINITHIFFKIDKNFLINFIEIANEIWGISFYAVAVVLLGQSFFEKLPF